MLYFENKNCEAVIKAKEENTENKTRHYVDMFFFSNHQSKPNFLFEHANKVSIKFVLQSPLVCYRLFQYIPTTFRMSHWDIKPVDWNWVANQLPTDSKASDIFDL